MRRVALAVFGTIAGLVGLLSFKSHEPTAATPAAAVSPATPGTTPTSTGSTSTGSTSTKPTSTGSKSTGSTSTGSTSTKSTSTGSAASSKATAKAGGTSKTVTGAAVDTRWGPVQVKITVTNGKITSATAVEYPENNGRDQEINATAIPTLQQESLGVSTSAIDSVSGATYTSQGYIGSLQSALDKAGL